MTFRHRARASLAGIIVLATACQDLNVPNTQQPDRVRALANPGDVESLVGAQFLVLCNRYHNRTAVYNALVAVADEATTTIANDGAYQISGEPRPTFANNTLSEVAGLSFAPYRDFNSMVASANDALLVIEGGLKIVNAGVDNTMRVKTFAKFVQGLGLAHLALYSDSAFVLLEGTQKRINAGEIGPLDLHLLPYTEVRDSAVRVLEEAAALADANTFTLPQLQYFKTRDSDNRELARIAHFYLARLLVYSARTPQEREAVDWEAVVEHTNKGLIADVDLPLVSGQLTTSLYSRIHATPTGGGAHRADNKLIGPADVSGTYQAWIDTPIPQRNRFDITTPDRRITGAGGPRTAGKYFTYRTDNTSFTESRGTYHFSAYQFNRNSGVASPTTTGKVVLWPKAENDLMKAEALYFLGDRAGAAALVNLTRVANGQLPPVTVDGAPQPNCVPRLANGDCANLYWSIIYERFIEAAGTDGMRAYFDSRGSDRLPEGTFIHIPLPQQEAIAIRHEEYTYGGVGGPGSVGPCTRVTLTCEPPAPPTP